MNQNGLLSTSAQKIKANILWIDEAIIYLGLDRIGIKRPDKAIHRIIKKGALHPVKISGRLAFDISELETVAQNGDQKRGRGRPRERVRKTGCEGLVSQP
jgi:hypothetical protein